MVLLLKDWFFVKILLTNRDLLLCLHYISVKVMCFVLCIFFWKFYWQTYIYSINHFIHQSIITALKYIYFLIRNIIFHCYQIFVCPLNVYSTTLMFVCLSVIWLSLFLLLYKNASQGCCPSLFLSHLIGLLLLIFNNLLFSLWDVLPWCVLMYIYFFG